MKRRLLYTILSISLLTVMAGAAIAPALGVISAHFAGRNPLFIQLIVSTLSGSIPVTAHRISIRQIDAYFALFCGRGRFHYLFGTGHFNS